MHQRKSKRPSFPASPAIFTMTSFYHSLSSPLNKYCSLLRISCYLSHQLQHLTGGAPMNRVRFSVFRLLSRRVSKMKKKKKKSSKTGFESHSNTNLYKLTLNTPPPPPQHPYDFPRSFFSLSLKVLPRTCIFQVFSLSHAHHSYTFILGALGCHAITKKYFIGIRYFYCIYLRKLTKNILF